jgi:hypothetical protein
MTRTEVLKSAHTLLSERGRWATGAYARDGTGQPVPVHDAYAVRFCALGAVWKAFGVSPGSEAAKVSTGSEAAFLLQRLCPRAVATYNDYGTHESILKLFAEAIELSEQMDRADEAVELVPTDDVFPS